MRNKIETPIVSGQHAGTVPDNDPLAKGTLIYATNARTEIKVNEINLRKLIGESFEQMKFIDGHEKTEVLVNLEISHLFYSDVFRMSVILDNLISNALKYVDTAKRKSFIHLKTAVSPSEMIMTIHDNGIGIFAKCLKKVFTRFYRATKLSEGAGLGLCIVKEMVDRLNGSISIASIPNKETIITLTIPNYPLNYRIARGQIVD